MNKEEMQKEETKTEEVKPEMPKKKKEKENKMAKEVERLQEEAKTKDEKILRLSAEMQNMRRRFDEEKAKLAKYDGEDIILKMLPILDNMEHAIKMDDNDLTDEVSKFLSGFKMIYGNMVDVVNNCGIEEIKCLHEPFDEASMNAVLVESTDEFDDNIVLDVLQKGYMYKDKVLRPAMVKVNKVEVETLEEKE